VVASVVHKRHWAAVASTICAREETRLRRLQEQRLDPGESARRRIRIEREALVSLGGLAAEGARTPLESQLDRLAQIRGRARRVAARRDRRPAHAG